MLRAKQRKVSNKTILRPKRGHIASPSNKSLKKVSNTNRIILCGILIFIITVLLIVSNPSIANTPNTANTSDHTINAGIASSPIDSYIAGIATIYVSIASLGDHACPLTVNNLFRKAKYPQNINVGIYQQNEAADPDCLAMLQYCTNNADQNKAVMHPQLGDISILCAMKQNIIINRTNIADGAKGPVYGRYMSMKLLPAHKKIDFVCMIDSHTLFRANWDEFTMQMWYSIEPNHRHAVITHYPWGAEHLDQRIEEENEYSYHICGSVYEGAPNFMVRNANGCFAKHAAKPVRVAFFAGGFSFAAAQFWRLVPLDPYLLYIFNGEEFDIATRGWTHGYDFYSPHVDIVGHYYDKGPKRRSPHVAGNEESYQLRDKSEKRLNYMWGLWPVRYPDEKDFKIEEIAKKAELRELAKYGLGMKRRLDEFWRFAGIDPVNKTITVFKEELYAQGGLQYVKWSQ